MKNSLGLKGGLLVLPEGIKKTELLIRAGKIAKIGEGVAEEADFVLNLDSLYIAPGFIDVQANGALGHEFLRASEDEILAILNFFVRHGTTGILATLTSAPLSELRSALSRLKGLPHHALLGVHLEGPFLAKARRGAHPKEFLHPPSLDFVRPILSEFREIVRLWTLAPELPGAWEVIEELKKYGVIVAFGHTDASYEEAMHAFSRGVSLATHLFNGMRPFHHRDPGPGGAALVSDAFVSLICDGVHLHPAVVKLVAKIKGFEKIVLITDAVSPTGLPDGEYPLFGQTVRVEQGIPRLPDGTLAGSTLTMNQAVKNFMAFTGCSLHEAVLCASLTPARLLGIAHRKGSIEEGKDADLVIFDPDFNVHFTIIGGNIVYART